MKDLEKLREILNDPFLIKLWTWLKRILLNFHGSFVVFLEMKFTFKDIEETVLFLFYSL